MDLDEPLKRWAIPLRAEVIPVELQDAYNHAYRQTSLAGHIQTDIQYSPDMLPFPSTLTNEQRQDALHAVKTWQEKLAQLQ